MLTDAKVRKLKPLEKKARYSDEKGMYLEVTLNRTRFVGDFLFKLGHLT